MTPNKELQHIARIGSNLSKEFTSPLSILVSTLEEFERNESNPNNKLKLKIALRNAYKFRALTRDVFTLSRMLSAPMLYRMVKTDVVQFVENIIDSFKPAAAEKHVELQFKSSVEELECYIDFQKTYRIIYKLIANGIRFMKPEGGIVRLSVFYLKEHEELQFEIWDNGIGIVEEKVPHLFDLFYEKDPIHLMFYQGTGIGLHLTKFFIEALKGKIQVESKKFSFTKFSVNLPCSIKKEDIPYELIEIIEDANFDELVLMEEVMIVDTDEIVQIKMPREQSTLVAILSAADKKEYWNEVWGGDADILFFTDVDKTLGKVLELVPDLIILQHDKDYLDAIEAVDFMRKSEVVSHIPIVLFNPDKSIDRNEMSEAGADDIIYEDDKPSEARTLLDRILKNRKLIFKAAYQEAVDSFKKNKALSLEDSFLAKINGLIDKHLGDENFNVEQLSEEMFMSRTQIHRKLRAITNMSTTHYVKKYKLDKAKEDLKAHTGTISEIAYKYGFSSPAYFSRVFSELYGMKPSEVIRNVN